MNADSGTEAELSTIFEDSLSNIVSLTKHHEDLLASANSIVMALKDGTQKHELYKKVHDIKMRMQRIPAMVPLQTNKIRRLEMEVQHHQHSPKITELAPAKATYAETS